METDSTRDRLSKAEIRKDALQEGCDRGIHTVGTVTTIVTSAIGDIARTVGGFATEIFEIRRLGPARRPGPRGRAVRSRG